MALAKRLGLLFIEKILLTGEVVSTPTEVPLTSSFLNSDQPRGGVVEKRFITSLHILNFDVISVTTRKKSLLIQVCFNFPHQIIVNKLA